MELIKPSMRRLNTPKPPGIIIEAWECRAMPIEGDPGFQDFARLVDRLSSEGREFVVAIVVDVRGSAAAKPGAKGVILPDGTVLGWLGGWCTERSILGVALEVLAFGRPRLVKLSLKGGEGGPRRAGDVIEVPTPCGGEVLLYLEPVQPQPLALAAGDHRVVAPLARILRIVGFRVAALTLQGVTVEDADLTLTRPDDIDKLTINGNTYIVLASMGNTEFDLEILEKLLNKSPAKIYIVASKRRAEDIARKLARKKAPQSFLERIESPAGLDLGAVTPQELALSVATAIVADRRGGSRKAMEELKGAPFKEIARKTKER